MQHANYKKHAVYGPGGRNCPCCGPCPRHRREHDRMVKRRERGVMKREVRLQVGSADQS